MRKMFSKNQIKEVVNEGIQSGEINSSYLLSGYFIDEDNEYFLVYPELTQDNTDIYSAIALHVDGAQVIRISIDFENQTISNENTETQISLDTCDMYLRNTITAEVIKFINI